MSQVVNYDELESLYKEIVFSGQEPNLICVFVNKNKTKAIRRKIGRFLKRGYTKKGNACPFYIDKPPYFGFCKV